MSLKSRICLAVLAILLIPGCSTYKPERTDNVCSIFRGNTDWYGSARDASKRWGVPVWVMMAIIDQESRFVDDAQPERDWFLFVPLPRRSTAYGYAQAQDPVWDQYMRDTGNSGHDRDDFADAINFVGWYTHVTQRTLGISKRDAYNQYLAYHEGHGGYKSGAWKSNGRLKQVARKVKNKSAAYNAQLKKCRPELDDEVDSWF